MTTIKQALKLASEDIDTSAYTVKLQRTTDLHYLYLAEAKDPDLIPSKLAIAVNRNTGKVGSSLESFEDAIKFSK